MEPFIHFEPNKPFEHFEPTKPLELFFFISYLLLIALLKRQTSEANIS